MTLQVGVKALLVRNDGKILLLKRSDRYGVVAGSWDIPGGRITPGTPLLANLLREIQEETGLVSVSTPRLIAAQDLLPNETAPGHIVRLTYSAKVEGDVVLNGIEHTEHQWVSWQELQTLEGLDTYVRALIASGELTEASLI